METRTLLQYGSAMPMVGFGTYYLTSEQCESAVKIALDNAIYGDYKFLYISPERLASERFIEYLKSMKVNLVTVYQKQMHSLF